MAEVGVVAESILILGIVMAIGFAAVKFRYVSANLRDSVATVIMKFTLLLLVITTLTKLEFTAELAKSAATMMAMAFISIFALFGLSCVTARFFKLSDSDRVVYKFLNCFGNAIFLGYPLIESVFGAEGLLYAAFYAFINDALLWTGGVYLVSREQSRQSGGSGKVSLKKLLNPATVSFLIAVVMLLFRVRLPGILQEVCSGIGSMTTYLSMLFIGMTLAQIDFRNIYKRGSLFFVSVFKMILIPVGLIYITKLLPLDPALRGAFILEVAMPAQTITTVLLERYGADTVYASEAIFVTTAISLGTLPLVYYLLQIL